jgi:hypothetical protein
MWFVPSLCRQPAQSVSSTPRSRSSSFRQLPKAVHSPRRQDISLETGFVSSSWQTGAVGPQFDTRRQELRFVPSASGRRLPGGLRGSVGDAGILDSPVSRRSLPRQFGPTGRRGNRTWRLAGLAWGGENQEATQQAMRELLATQKPDGGWSDIDTMESSAYATGRALHALRVAGLSASNQAYERGVQYLLKTQQEDGSWFVQSRAMTFQPYFDSGFPHGYNQWISAAATSWATLALTQASTAAKTTVAAR